MLARLFVIIGGLFVLALTAALVGPYFVDWTGYRAEFEREASAVLGRKVTVQGEAEARLLPFPSVTFSDVSVGGGPGGEPAMTIETFSMDAELAPFISGEILIFDMRMVRPKATIDIAADGRVDWAMRPSAPFDAAQISIEKLTVTEGQIAIRHAASGRTHLISEINADISARSLAGPWRVGGAARLDGMRTGLAISTGAVNEAGTMPLRITADPESHRIGLELDGSLRFEDGAPVYAGVVKASGKPARTATAQAKADDQPPGYRLNGRFSLGHERLAVEEFVFETGPLDNPYSAEGQAFVELGPEPSFSISADGAQMRLDEALGEGEATGTMSFSERIEALELAFAALPKPSIPGVVEVNLPAVLAGDTTIRDVQLSAEPAEDGWTVKSFAATLPGRATLEADGRLSTVGDLGFSGSLLLAVGQPSGFAAWLSKDVDDAIRRLPAAGFRAEVELTHRRQSFADLELVLGDAVFKGRAESSQPRNARATSALTLEGGALDVDGLAAFGSLFVSDSGENRFAEHDLDFRIKAGPVSAGEMAADTVDAALRLREGLLEIDRLSIGGLEGASISATGTISGFPEKPVGNLDASILAADLAPLISAAAARYPEQPLLQELESRAAAHAGLFTDARLDLEASAGNEDGSRDVEASLQGATGGTDFTATLSAGGAVQAADAARISLKADARNQDAAKLLALYGLPVLPLGLIGPGETRLAANGSLGGGFDATASLTGPDFSAGFDGAVTLAAGPAATGSVKLQAADLEPWMMTTGAVIPGMGAGLQVELGAEAVYADGMLMLAGIEGTVDQEAVSGDLNAAMKDGKPHVTGALALDLIDFNLLAEMVLGAAAVEDGGDGWSSTPFAQASATPFTGEVTVSAASLEAGALASAHDANLSLRIDEEGIRVSDLSATVVGGEIAGLFELKNSGGTALLSGQMKLTGADLASALGTAGLSGRGNFSAALSSSGKSVSGLVAALSGSGTAALHSLAIAGVNPDALARYITEADRVGRAIDAAATRSFAPEIAGAGAFSAAPVEIAFTVAGGVVRVPPVTFVNPAATLEANIQADLNAGTAAVSGQIVYDAGDEALVGSEPAVRYRLEGPIGGATRSFDTEPLAQFLTQRALEIEQARVEAMQAALLEKQRLRREVRYYAAVQEERERANAEMRRLEEAARLKDEAEAKAAQEARETQAREDLEQRARLEADRQARLEAERQARVEEQEMEAREAERRRAEEAERLAADERAREAQASGSAIERTPLPPASDEPTPAPGDPAAQAKPTPFEPFSIDSFLESLQSTQ